MFRRVVPPLAAAALAAVFISSQSALAAEPSRLETFVAPSGDEGYFALGLSPNIAQPPDVPRDTVVLFDTSASQSGDFRVRAKEALTAFLQALSPADKVSLWAVDLAAIPLTENFVAASSAEMTDALARLDRRVPLGTTDMVATLQAAISSYAGKPEAGRARAAVYIGDGLSPTNLVTSDRLSHFADRLTAMRVPFSCLAIGPRVNGQLLGALANTTGGAVFTDDAETNAASAGQQLADMAHGWVIWPTKFSMSDGYKSIYYRAARPLRFDRRAILVGSFPAKADLSKPVSVRLAGSLAGKSVSLAWNIVATPSSDDQAFLRQLVEAANHDHGVSLPTAGDRALEQVRVLFNAGANGLAQLGRQAAITGDFNSAERLADAATKVSPSDQDALILRRAAEKSKQVRQASFAQTGSAAAPPVPDVPPPPEAADGDLLNEVEQQQTVFQGFLRTEVRNALNEARANMGSDPATVVATLKLMLDKVRSAGEASPEVRAQLADQIEAVLRMANHQALIQGEKELERQQIIAEGEARERINRQLFLQEQKVDQLMARFNALMDEERFRDAEAIADIAEELEPFRPGLRGAELTARMVGWTVDMAQIRDMRHRGFVDATMQIELSHIPTADEPPILYPDPEVWQLLTERRKKYKSVDLKSNNPNEQKIMSELENKTEIDFAEQPLSDVIDYLKNRHEIEIQLDNRALTDAGIGSDTPITRTIKDISLRSALKLILSELDLTYVIRNEVLMITSKTEAESMLSTRVYPVGDLVVPIRNPMMMMGGGRGRF